MGKICEDEDYVTHFEDVDYKKLEVIAIHKPDLKKVEIAWLVTKGYLDGKIEDTLYKVETHKGVAQEEKMLAKYDISASYETTGWDAKTTQYYCFRAMLPEDYLLYLTGQIIADPRD